MYIRTLDIDQFELLSVNRLCRGFESRRETIDLFAGDLSIFGVFSLYFSTPPPSTEMKKGEAGELPLFL